MAGRDAGGELVMAAAEVLDERVPGGDDTGRAEPFETAHRPQPQFQPSVIGLDRIISVPLDDVQAEGISSSITRG